MDMRNGFLIAVCLGLGFVVVAADEGKAQSYTPATQAFENSPVCSDSDLSADPLIPDLARGNPEWKPVNGLSIDPLNPAVHDKPTILQGFVSFPPANESSNAQAPAEVSEEEIPWNHYTHDFTFKVTPDPTYQHLLSSWERFPGGTIPNIPVASCEALGGLPNGTSCVIPGEVCPDLTTGDTCHHTEMEVEWENASLMSVNDDDDRTWGAVPEYVWPASGDRVWVMGRWIFDCGHPAADSKQYVKFSTEIHPPRALVTYRLNHTALSSLNNTLSQSWLPVTGDPVTLPPDAPNTGPTNLPVTEADVFVSGNGGGANDLCMLMGTTGDNDCRFGHTSPVLPVNDLNYVFDIYPPGTNYLRTTATGNFPVTPPVADASLQFRTVDHAADLPGHACGAGTVKCITLIPVYCLIDDATLPPDPDPDKADPNCPAVPEHPTRLRVILPFASTRDGNLANYFAKSILLGWDDVPKRGNTLVTRNVKVTLHAFTVKQNGEGCSIADGCFFPPDGDWRVFVNVAGQWRYISPLFDRDANGRNLCNGDALTENGDDDCFLFDQTPWLVSVQDGTPIHVGVGGYESDHIDADFCGAPDYRSRYPLVCDPQGAGLVDASLALMNDARIGTYEFDLRSNLDYEWRSPDGATLLTEFTTDETDDEEQYKVEFQVQELPAPTPPSSAPLNVGDPHYGNFITSHTPLAFSALSADVERFQYRSYLTGAPLPTLPIYSYTEYPEHYPVHWTYAYLDFPSMVVGVGLSGADGPYVLQHSAENFAHLLEPRHSQPLTLDNTPPVSVIGQPQAIAYPHSAVLTLNYSTNDGSGAGVAEVATLIDNATSLAGHGLASGQPIKLLTELPLGPHAFTINASDFLNNAGNASVQFTIIATTDSIKDDVRQFLHSGAIKNAAVANLLLVTLNAAGRQQQNGHCAVARGLYNAFIHEVQAQSGKRIDGVAADIMAKDAQYLIAHCP